MNAKQLKDSILQYATQGKLVPQEETDEPALRLIERIKAEKEWLIQQKIIKKEKPLPPIKEEEIPFDIPETWEWVRLGNISKVIGDGMHGTPTYDNSGEFYFINGSNLKNDCIIINDVTKKISLEVFEANRKLLDEATILMSINGTLGSLARYNFEPVMLGKSAAYITLVNKDYLEYIYLFFQSDIFKKYYEKKYTGTTIKNIPLKALRECPIPLPPLQEQERIVEKVLSIKSQLESYREKYEELQAISQQFPGQLEKSILQYAMQGKLVPQIGTDEPASKLIERIKAEKERLVKGKVIKKAKALPPIKEEEIPFDIPESWAWVRLGEIIHLISGRDLTTKEYGIDSTGVPYITGASNFNNGELEILRWTHEPKALSFKGDLLITCKGTIGEMAIQELEQAHIARQVMAIRIIDKLNTEYVQLFLKSVVNDIKNSAKSMIPGISREDILERLIPIPPYEEQGRIVKQLNVVKKQLNRFN